MKHVLLFVILLIPARILQSQPLNATRNDALYTTYAAPLSRSAYKNDQGYQMKFNDPASGIEFISRQGPNLGIAFVKDRELRLSLSGMHSEPVITMSYSDLVGYFYYPFKDIRAEVVFDVYSSQDAILEIRLKNEGAFPAGITVAPYIFFPSQDSVNDFRHRSGYYSFRLNKPRDGWMREHQIPVAEHLEGAFASTLTFDSVSTFTNGGHGHDQVPGAILLSAKNNLRQQAFVKGISGFRTFHLAPGDITSFRLIVHLDTENKAQLTEFLKKTLSTDINQIIRENQTLYSRIPALKDLDKDHSLFYQSCFSLLRQCMMPPEGQCKTNYYVFSREPRWGWGYGGQVFHESLAMLAYVYMDPDGAMNSQRVYFGRQHPDGYINYRTGPYLNESIPYDSTLTSSAPWFNYQNLEIFKVTGDMQFLREAYDSGKKFYSFYVASRDSNHNGLCEWGGEASLESVRDARVAVWDQVGWPSNFEGPDINAMLVMEAKSLARMAELLGYRDEMSQWLKDAEDRSELINRYLWDEQTGFYYNVNRNDQSFTRDKENDLKIREIIGFLPYWAGIPDKNRSERLMLTLKDTSMFWRPYGVPTLSAGENYYNPIGYWNGPVWVQWDYLIFRGLLDHGDTTAARILANRVIDNMIWHLKKDHTFWEFYSPDDRQAGWNQTYIWAGIAVRFMLDFSNQIKVSN